MELTAMEKGYTFLFFAEAQGTQVSGNKCSD